MKSNKTAKAIGNYVVALITTKQTDGQSMVRQPCISILQDSFVDDNAYSPPQSVMVSTEDCVRALRDACNEALGEEVKP